MKKTLSLFLALILLLSLCACGKSQQYNHAIETAEEMNNSYNKVCRYYNSGNKSDMKYELIIFMEHFNNTLDRFLELNSDEMQSFMSEISKQTEDGYQLLYSMLSGKITSLNQDPSFYNLYMFATS